ncbi:MAG: DUF433 domain-containing protein [Saprospiraceae bacterium]
MKDYMNRISINPKIMFGKPVVRGTRITVEQILEDLGSGKTNDELLEMYPSITALDIKAALQFASDALRGERTYPIAI